MGQLANKHSRNANFSCCRRFPSLISQSFAGVIDTAVFNGPDFDLVVVGFDLALVSFDLSLKPGQNRLIYSMSGCQR